MVSTQPLSKKICNRQNGFILPNISWWKWKKIFELPPPSILLDASKNPKHSQPPGICTSNLRKNIGNKWDLNLPKKWEKKPTKKFTWWPFLESQLQGTCIDSRGTLGSQKNTDPNKNKAGPGNGFNEGLPQSLPSLKLTQHLKMDVWKTSFLLGWPSFRSYVSFRECIFCFNYDSSLLCCLDFVFCLCLWFEFSNVLRDDWQMFMHCQDAP